MIRQKPALSVPQYFVWMFRIYRSAGRGRVSAAWQAFRDATARVSF